MKKVFAVFIVFVLVFSLSACKKAEEAPKHSVDVEYYAKIGQMPESEYKIGDDVEKMQTELSKEFEENEDAVFNFIEGEKTAMMDTGIFNYFYYLDKADEGISYIVNLDKAFGFEIGTVSIEVLDALSEFEYKTEKLNDKNGFFILSSLDGEVIKYTFKDYTVSFIFIDNALYASTIYKTVDWE